MKLKSITLKNFRRVGDLRLDFDGSSAFLIAENAGGKTSVLLAIARALGHDLSFALADFVLPDRPIEVVATLTDLNQRQLAEFAERVEYVNPISLTVGALATWDPATEQIEIRHGYPRHAWARSTRSERDALPLVWLPAWRDPSRILAFGAARGVLVNLLNGLPLTATLGQAMTDIQRGAQTLRNDPILRGLLDDAGVLLEQLVPSSGTPPFDVGIAAMTERELLRQFELLMAYPNPSIPVGQQSSGLGQLAVFAFAAMLIQQAPDTLLLLDEPEISLHPQAQRALVALLNDLASQSIVATHSSNVLDGVDPRQVVRLYENGGQVEAARAVMLTEPEAKRLARLSTPLTAEAFFARKVILVEGITDVLSIRELARRKGRNLDAEGIALLSLDGGGGFESYVKLLGPRGLRLKLVGLCDADQEMQWATWLGAAGLGNALDRAGMEALGFFVCDVDLEDELIRAVGTANVLQLISSEGEGAAFQSFAQQTTQQGKTQEDQIRAFFSKQRRKARYAPLLVALTAQGSEPRPLVEVLARA